TRDFEFLNSQATSDQWKSQTENDIIQFNGKGVLVFLTQTKTKYDALVAELINKKYKSLGIDIKGEMEVETYSKDNKTVFLTSLPNPKNNQKIFSTTFIDK